MRKAIIEVTPNRLTRSMWGDLFDTVDHLEGREILQLNFERGIKLVIVDIFMKEGYTIDDVKLPKRVEVLNVLKSDRSRYTVLLKAKIKGQFLERLMKLFDLDLIYDMPYYADPGVIRMSCIGEGEPIRKLVGLIGILGNVEKVSFTGAAFSEFNILNVLTDKQKEILLAAKKNGYYEYPRKVNTQQLSEKLGISKATTVEHLRKAEMRLMNSMLEGY